MAEKEYALIVAGGKGTRFKSSQPKQFLALQGKPVLLHTLEAFYRYSAAIHVVLVLPEEDRKTWEMIAREYAFDRPLSVQPGGNTRFQSVKRGLERIGDGYVAIHDGVRPLVTPQVIGESFRIARIHQNAIAAVELKDSIRMTEGTKDSRSTETKAVDRSRFRIVQTPQTFRTDLIKEAYSLSETSVFTDDASVAERAGITVRLFEGSYENIKITTPEDLVIAESILRYRTGRQEVGY